MFPNIVYYCPCVPQPSGGVAVLLKQATILQQHGYDVTVVYHPRIVQTDTEKQIATLKLLETEWLDFAIHGLRLVPIGNGIIQFPNNRQLRMLPELPLTRDVLFIIPEGFPNLMQETQSSLCKRLVYAQNWMYLLQVLPNGVTYKDYGIHHVLTVGEWIKTVTLRYMPELEVQVVRYSINRQVFKPGQSKEPLITYQCRNPYMLDKATVISKIFYLKNPHLSHYRFELLQGLSRPAFADKLAYSTAVLYLDEIAGMPTLPLEAMACHTIPVGWRTPGGSEFMTEENGFWVTNGDIIALAETLANVINAYEQRRLNLTQLELGFEKTLTLFSEEREQRETLAYFSRLIDSLW